MTDKSARRRTFVADVFHRARQGEKRDINNNRKRFLSRNARYMAGISAAIIAVVTLPEGFSMDFLQLAATILSVFIGLFIAALVFALDKFNSADHGSSAGDYRMDINENNTTRNVEISIDEISFPDSREKLARRQAHRYLSQFNAVTGKSVLLSVWALALLCVNILYHPLLSADLRAYTFTSDLNLHTIALFMGLVAITALRGTIAYLLTAIFYDTTRIVSSLVNFMSARIDRSRPSD